VPFGPELVYWDLAERPVDLPDDEAERERSSRPGESSLAVVLRIRTTRTSEAEAATERSKGVAGAERLQAPVNLPQGEPSIRAEASRGRCPEGQNYYTKYTE